MARGVGWGHVERRGKNVWRIRFMADMGDGRGFRKQSETFHGTARAAQRRKAELQSQYDLGRAHTPVPTFRELWLQDVRPDLERTMAPNTLRSYLSAWGRVEARWGAVRLDAYTGAEVQDWLAGVPRRTGRACLMLMRKVSNRAVLLGLMPTDPLAAQIRVGEASMRAAERTETDLAPYFSAARQAGPLVLAGVALMAAGGCRVGEALAVRADSVRWDEGANRAVFEVADQVSGVTGQLEGRLKNAQSARVASVPGELGREVAEVASDALAQGLAFVVDTGQGKPVSPAVFRNHWKAACEGAGLEPLTLRSLRRSFATAALDAGADMGEVNISMGHTRDSRVLFTNYDRPDRRTAPVLPDMWAVENRDMHRPK